MNEIKTALRKQWFQPTILGLALNPVFIARRGLFLAIKRVAPRLHGKVLDFGCGSKPYENLFTSADSYLGCDLDVSGHDHRDSRIDCFYDGERLPFQNSTFDAVVSFETFEHIFNLSTILAEVRRVTKESGYLLISIPFAWEEHEIPYDFARYTSYGMRRLLEDRGYEVIDLQKTTTQVLAVFQLFIAYLHLHVLPAKGIWSVPFRLLLTFPITILAYVMNAVLPRSDRFFCNLVILAKKT